MKRVPACTRVPQRECLAEAGRVTDAAGADQRRSQVAQLVDQRLRAQRPGMTSGVAVDADQPPHPGIERLERPAPLGDIVVDDAAVPTDEVHDQRGLPSAVMKKRMPSSSAMSIHERICRWNSLTVFSMMALKPSACRQLADASDPLRKSRPWAKTIDIGWTTPSAPASLAAATSSGLEQGYIAPQISGRATPASR